MSTSQLLHKPIPQISKLLQTKELSYTELVKEVVKNINTHEDKIGAYLTLTTDQASKQAQDLDKRGAKSQNPLFGIPISVKDTFTTKGVRTTVASKMLEDFIPPYDATSYKRLKEQGTILLGKTNMDEFAHGFTTEYSAFKATKNPWNLKKVPGGSSGGSAASVASRMALLSLASENFGSIIQPSALCGVVGMKPTYGRASRYGIIAMASSLECPGIIGRCVEDVTIGIEAISGWDSLDATTVRQPKEDYYKNLKKDVKGRKIAVIKPIIEKINPEILSTIEKALEVFKKSGANVEYIDWYDLELDLKIYDVLYRAEVSSNLARYDGLRYGYRSRKKHKSLHEYYIETRKKFGKHVKRQIITDPITLKQGEDDIYTSALRLRRKNRQYIDNLFKKFCAIVTPASTFINLDIGKVEDPAWREENRELAKINGAMMCPTVLYGYPAISFPIGFSKSKMPVGIQMFSGRFEEQTLFDLAYTFQEETGLKCLMP